MKLECRNFTEYGNMMETMMSVMMTSLFTMNLIHILEIGVDTAKLTFNKYFEYLAQSRGGGGIDKYSCAVDYQESLFIKHQKLGHTERLYVHDKMCPKKLISTELQSMWFTDDEYAQGTGDSMDNMLADMILMSARRAISKQVEHTDIIGVFGGGNQLANSYDGVLAQAYWAYTLLAYFHSVKITIDETLLTDGSYLHLKYSGMQETIDIQFDSTQVSDPSVNRYATYAEVYQAAVNWLNNDVLTESGRKYVDATYSSNEIWVTSKWTEREVQLLATIDTNPTVDNWADCDKQGVTYQEIQGRMPIDERPHLVKWQRYTPENILVQLPKDIYEATRDIEMVLKPEPAQWALCIDPRVMKMYRYARQVERTDGVSGNIEDEYNVLEIPALAVNGGTGLWFITTVADNEEFRNIAHLVDTVRSDSDLSDIYVGPADLKCREAEILYDTLHGVTVKDWRIFASNLLCSPFVDTFKTKEPWEKTLPMLPCWNKRVRDSFVDQNSNAGNCRIHAQFEITDEYQNSALYAVPLPGGGYDIRVLEDGETLPNGSLPVYEIQVTDKTVGILPSQITEVEYEYTVQTQDGTEVVYTDKNPVIPYVGNAAGTAFNITQVVTIPSIACTGEFDASESFDEDFPFHMAGGCNDIDLQLDGRIDLTNDYTITGANWQGEVNITTPSGAATINLSGNTSNDPEGAAVIINDYLTSNGFAGTAVGDNDDNSLTVSDSVDVVFANINLEDLFVRENRITIIDSTVWDAADGIDTIGVKVWCQGDAEPASYTFDSLPDLELIDSCVGDGWNVEVDVTTILGCTFEDLQVSVAEITPPAQSANFTITQDS